MAGVPSGITAADLARGLNTGALGFVSGFVSGFLATSDTTSFMRAASDELELESEDELDSEPEPESEEEPEPDSEEELDSEPELDSEDESDSEASLTTDMVASAIGAPSSFGLDTTTAAAGFETTVGFAAIGVDSPNFATLLNIIFLSGGILPVNCDIPLSFSLYFP